MAAFICTHVLSGPYPASAEDGKEEYGGGGGGAGEAPRDGMKGGNVANRASLTPR